MPAPTIEESTSLLDRLAPPGRTIDGHVVVRLDDEDWALAHLHGARRVAANKAKKDRASYRNGLNEEDRRANTDAVLCEVAVARHLGIDWDWDMASWKAEDHHKFRHRADVGTNIEVRRIRKPHNPPSLRPWQVGKGLILFAAFVMPPEGMNVRIIGWRDYDEAWELAGQATYDKKGSGSRTLTQDHLLRCTCFYTNAKHVCDPQPLFTPHR